MVNKQTEAELHKECYKFARQMGLLVCSSPAGAFTGYGASSKATGVFKQANAQRHRGVTPGFPDMLVLHRGKDNTCGLAVELKTPKTGRVSLEQVFPCSPPQSPPNYVNYASYANYADCL